MTRGNPLEDEDSLDEALAQTFPASDPVASWAGPARPPRRRRTRRLAPLPGGLAPEPVDEEEPADPRVASALAGSFPCSDAPSSWAGPPRG
ncbi:MAG: hypothetical protein AB7N76_10915 [Planctomycetota bacterium]